MRGSFTAFRMTTYEGVDDRVWSDEQNLKRNNGGIMIVAGPFEVGRGDRYA
jgi:hypothetical protein